MFGYSLGVRAIYQALRIKLLSPSIASKDKSDVDFIIINFLYQYNNAILPNQQHSIINQ